MGKGFAGGSPAPGPASSTGGCHPRWTTQHPVRRDRIQNLPERTPSSAMPRDAPESLGDWPRGAAGAESAWPSTSPRVGTACAPASGHCGCPRSLTRLSSRRDPPWGHLQPRCFRIHPELMKN
ncbi:urotensin-2 isoform X1 [Calypte anna]|uniref:urotensin-2 isoform X1 n=1 Tax=Calypte anna TaxID=9244 RepID=UPI0011C4597A|nr:urotensin-2 isoform X1 [Calypte anna]